MPTVSVSSQISQAVYFIAVLSLAGALAKPVYGVYTASQERGAQVTAAGIASMLDSLSPGESVTLKLVSYPGLEMSSSLAGSTVKVTEGPMSGSAQVRWLLPTLTLEPGLPYTFALTGTSVSVVAQNG